MAKLRLLFTKEAQASYISHLDTMRTFQRVFPRAELHLKHSNGFGADKLYPGGVCDAEA